MSGKGSKSVTYRARSAGNEPIVLDLSTCTRKKYRRFINKFGKGKHGVFVSTFASYISGRRKHFQLAPKTTRCVNYFDILFITDAERLECRFLEPDFYFIAFRRPSDEKWLSLTWRESVMYEVSHLDMDLLIPEVDISYGSLERPVKRSNLNLGKHALIKAVETLAQHKNKARNPQINSCVLTICQMVPECARNPLILDSVCDFFERGGTLSSELVRLQNVFSKMCKKHIAGAIREDVNGIIMTEEEYSAVSLLLQTKFVRFDFVGALESYVVARADCNEEMARRLDRDNDEEGQEF